MQRTKMRLHFFFVDKLDQFDIIRIYGDYVFKSFIWPTSQFTLKKIEYKEGMKLKPMPYIKADGVAAL